MSDFLGGFLEGLAPTIGAVGKAFIDNKRKEYVTDYNLKLKQAKEDRSAKIQSMVYDTALGKDINYNLELGAVNPGANFAGPLTSKAPSGSTISGADAAMISPYLDEKEKFAFKKAKDKGAIFKAKMETAKQKQDIADMEARRLSAKTARNTQINEKKAERIFDTPEEAEAARVQFESNNPKVKYEIKPTDDDRWILTKSYKEGKSKLKLNTVQNERLSKFFTGELNTEIKDRAKEISESVTSGSSVDPLGKGSEAQEIILNWAEEKGVLTPESKFMGIGKGRGQLDLENIENNPSLKNEYDALIESMAIAADDETSKRFIKVNGREDILEEYDNLSFQEKTYIVKALLLGKI